MEKKLCVLTPEAMFFKTSDAVLWFNHPDTDDEEYNNEHVRIYTDPKSEAPFIRCDVSKIKEVDQSMTEI